MALGGDTEADIVGGVIFARSLELFIGDIDEGRGRSGEKEGVSTFGVTGDNGVTSFSGPGVGAIPGDHPETVGLLSDPKPSVFSGVGPDKLSL